MGFIKGKKDEITVHVKAQLDMDLGKVENVNFKAKYKVLSPAESKSLVSRFTDDDDAMSEEGLVRETLIGWSDLNGDDGEPVEFNMSTLEEILTIREYLAALVQGFMLAQFGKKAVNGKN